MVMIMKKDEIENNEFEIKVKDSIIKVDFIDEDTTNIKESIVDILTASYNERSLK